MSETALLSNYQKSEDDDALQWLRSYTAQNTKPEKEKSAAPAKASEPVKPGGFFNALASAPKGIADFLYPAAPVEGAGTVRRIAEKAIETMAGGAKDVGEAVAGTPPTEPQGAVLETPIGNIPVPESLHRVGKALMGGINVTPAGGVIGAAGQTGQEIQGGMESLLPSLTDEKLHEQIDQLKAVMANPAVQGLSPDYGTGLDKRVKQLELLLQKPYDERVRLAQEETGQLFEIVAGAMPMPLLLGAGKAMKTAAGAVGGAAREADTAAHAARIEAMRVAGERIAAARAEQQTAQAAQAAKVEGTGGPRPALTLADVRQGMAPEVTPGVKAGPSAPGSIPENMMTLDKLHARQRLEMLQNDPEAAKTMDEAIPEAAPTMSPPGVGRVRGESTREALRAEHRTSLEGEISTQQPPAKPVEITAYHGTTEAFQEFKPEAGVYSGTWFSERPETASHYARGEGGNVHPVKLRLEHPAPEELYQESLNLMQGDPALASELLKSKGYDGVAFTGDVSAGVTGKGNTYLVFDPNLSAVPLYDAAAKKAIGLPAEEHHANIALAAVQDASGINPMQGAALHSTVAKVLASADAAPLRTAVELAMKDAESPLRTLALKGLNQEGKINTAVLFALSRAAAGAVVGSLTGDDLESSARNALLAAGVGAVLSPRLARTIAENIAKPGVRAGLERAFRMQGEEGALRFPTRGGDSPNTARMGASKEAKQLVRGINEKLSEAGKLDRDVTKPWEQTRAEAARSPFNTVEGVLGMDTATLTLDELDGAITAARDVRDMALESVLQKAAQAKLSKDAALAEEAKNEFLLSGKISQQVTNAQTAYGRGLGAQRMQSKASRAATKYNIDNLEAEMSEMRKAMLTDGNVSDLQLMDMITNLADKAAAAKIAEAGSKWPKALWNIYYGLNLLSSPLTQARNVIGNMGGLSIAVVDRAFGEIVAAPFHAFGKGENLVQLGETYQLAKGLYQVIGDTFRMAKDAKAVPGGMRTAFTEAYRTGESQFLRGGSKTQEMLRTIEIAKEQGNGSLPVLIQAMSTLAEKNMRLMGGVDEAFKVLTFHGELRALALREAKGAGKEGKALAEEIERLVATPSKDMLAMAEAAAHENTFTKAFSSQGNGWRNLGGLGGKLEDVAQNPVMKLLVSPFYRTPMRIGEFSTVHTPGLNFLAVQFYSDLAEGGVKANMAWAKLATGGAMVGLVGWYAAHGYITGNWPDDPGLRAAYERAQWKPKSLYIPMLGKYVSYDNLEPISSIVGTVADTIQIARDLPEWHASTLMTAATIAAGKNSINKTWFQGVSDLVDVIEGATRGESVEKMMQAAENRLVSLVPGAAAMRLAANATDDQRRDRKRVVDHEHPEQRELDTLLNAVKAIVPGWSKTRPAIPNMITGEPLPSENSWLGALSPFQFSTLKTDKVLQELVALDGAGLPKELPRAIGGSAPPSPFKFPGDEEREVREGILMSDQERARLGTILTKEVEDENGDTLHKALGELMDSEEYKDASDGRFGGKSRLMASKFQEFMGLAQQQLLDEYLKLDAAVRHRKVLRDLGQLPKSEEDQRSSIIEQATGQ